MVLWKFPLWLLGQPSGISREKYCKKCSCSMWPFIILSDRWWDREMSGHPSPGRWLSQLAGPGSGHFSYYGPGRVSGCESQAGVGARNCTIMFQSQCQGPDADMTLLWHRAPGRRMLNIFILSLCHVSYCHMYEPCLTKSYVEREIFVFRWRIVFEGLFCCFCFSAVALRRTW